MRTLLTAKRDGARLMAGGEPDGQLLPPHVFTDVSPDNVLAREESFGPVVPILRARNEDDALLLTNATDYGLSSAVFTDDLERGVRFAQAVEAGMTHVNDTWATRLTRHLAAKETTYAFPLTFHYP